MLLCLCAPDCVLKTNKPDIKKCKTVFNYEKLKLGCHMIAMIADDAMTTPICDQRSWHRNRDCLSS